MDAVGGQGADVLTSARGMSRRAARYGAWFAAPLGHAMDAAEAHVAVAIAAPCPGERVLDAGCGTGLYTQRLVASRPTVTGLAPLASAAAPDERALAR